MRLKSFEAHGFKSFADKVNVNFENGITAIVGPNGSGKSNISDAIRWVMGEQSIKYLRGTKMEDVIFAGSSARRPLGMADVTMIFRWTLMKSVSAAAYTAAVKVNMPSTARTVG